MELIKLCYKLKTLFNINFQSWPCMHEILQILITVPQCAVPESVTTGQGPVSWLSPEPQPELQPWRYSHYPSTTISAFPVLCPLVCRSMHCLVLHPKLRIQDLSRPQHPASHLEFFPKVHTTVFQMPCLSKEFAFCVKVSLQHCKKKFTIMETKRSTFLSWSN